MLERTRRWSATLLLAALAAGAGGCEAIERLRSFFNPSAAAELEGGAAGLVLQVQPAHDLVITLDGVTVGDRSPFESRRLRAGNHLLRVQAPGHHPFVLPLTIADGQVLTVPITLRRLSAAPTSSPSAPSPAAAPIPAPPPEPPAAALPAGVQAITLQVVGEPALTPHLDGQPLPGKEARLERVEGALTLGNARLRYRIGGAGLLELVVPEDGAQWFRDGEPIEPNTAFTLHRGATRLQQIGASGEAQTLLIKR